MTGVLASFRYLLADVLGIDDAQPPAIPDDWPEPVKPVVREAIPRLIDFQGPSYAQLYMDRLGRFVRRRGMNDTLLAELAQLMAQRMCYADPVRCAQLALASSDGRPPTEGGRAIERLWVEDMLASLPAGLLVIPIIGVSWAKWCRTSMHLRFAAARHPGRFGLKTLASLRRWRPVSGRYAVERVWVERWLHMIDRSLVKQPQAAPAIVQSAAMIHGHGQPYRQAVADWHAIIDGLAKPTFDGELVLPDLAGAIAEARAAAAASPEGGALRSIAAIRARTVRAV
ncbi:MAG TPA: DUF6537 domain-containing protein [Xanthobacteraceae bacterium]|jgi:hypothetical protein